MRLTTTGTKVVIAMSRFPQQGAMAYLCDTGIAIRDRILSHRTFKATSVQASKLAEHIVGMIGAGGFPLEWALAAIDDCAGEVLSKRLAGEPVGQKAVYQLIIRWSRRPRKPHTKDSREQDKGGDADATRERHVKLMADEERAWVERNKRWAEDVDKAPSRAQDILKRMKGDDDD